MTHGNEDLIRSGYEAFGRGDVAAVAALFADDIAWHIGGASLISGDYRGPQEVMGFFGQLGELSGGTFRLEVHDILANDEHAVVLLTARGERDGQVLAAREVHIWHVGRRPGCTEFWAFAEDQADLDKFFS